MGGAAVFRRGLHPLRALKSIVYSIPTFRGNQPKNGDFSGEKGGARLIFMDRRRAKKAGSACTARRVVRYVLLLFSLSIRRTGLRRMDDGKGASRGTAPFGRSQPAARFRLLRGLDTAGVFLLMLSD